MNNGRFSCLIYCFLASALYIPVALSQDAAALEATTYIAWKFTLEVPNSIHGEKEMPADFEVYRFRQSQDPKSDAILVAYAGNHPNTMWEREIPTGVVIQALTLGTLTAKSIEWTDGKGRFYRKTLVALPKQFGVPQYVLFSYRKMDSQEKQIADKIIESIKAIEVSQ